MHGLNKLECYFTHGWKGLPETNALSNGLICMVKRNFRVWNTVPGLLINVRNTQIPMRNSTRFKNAKLDTIAILVHNFMNFSTIQSIFNQKIPSKGLLKTRLVASVIA
jgi:hypothetical protein